MKLRFRNVLALLLTLALLLGCLPQISALAGTEATAGTSSVNKTALSLGNSNEKVEIMVMLDGETTYVQTGDLELAAASADRQLSTLKKAELTIEKKIAAQIEVENTYSLLFNGFSFTGEAWMIDAINQIPGYTAFESPMMELIEPETTDEETLTPSMYTSTGLIGADKAWNYGYTGEGMVVAILDTGIRQTHEAFSVMPENGKIDKDYLKEVFEKYGDKIHAGNGEYDDGMYYNEKLPFNWDYFDGDAIPNHTASDHGTHVAGIAAGNNGKGFQGVAPDAQIVVMQVSDSNGGAQWSEILCALEDCVYLGVDALNMSLGLTAGFTGYGFISEYLEGIYDALENAGVSVCVAAGNDENSAVWNNYANWYSSVYRWLAANPDVGVIGAPASFRGSFAVGSVNNMDVSTAFYVSAYGSDYTITPSAYSAPTLGTLEEGTYEIIYLGLGQEADYEGVDVTDKIVLAKRGDNTFTNKAENALAHGAAGIIVFNNVSGTVSTGVSIQIPYGVLSLEDGEKLLNCLEDGKGSVSIVHALTYNSVTMASSSSWGTTGTLEIKPEIAAPGNNITSAIGFSTDDSYASWNGTSMATPHIAGSMLLIKERLKELYPDKSLSEINELAYAFAMSTAHQISGFVRQQGAGLIDVNAALETQAYLSVPNSSRPKLNLDDSEDGKFTFTVVVNNIGNTEKIYSIDYSALTEQVTDFLYDGDQMHDRDFALETGFYIANPEAVWVKTINGTVKDVTDLCELERINDNKQMTVKVPAGESITVEMTLSCSEELMKYFEENCEAGMYLEGFVKFIDQDEDGIDLSVPFLGYVGDWDEPAMFDSGFYWQSEFGVNNMQQMTTSTGRYVGFGSLEQGLGLNYYADMKGQTYMEDRNAISPNGDGKLDAVDYMEFTLLRAAKRLRFYITDPQGNILQMLYDGEYALRKSYFSGTTNGGVTYSSVYFDFTGEDMEENETVNLVLEAWLEHDEYHPDDNSDGRWIVPVTKDTVAPLVKAITGGIEISDANYISYYAIYSDFERSDLIYEKGVFAEERGVSEQYLTELDEYFVFTADYARNEAFYLVSDGTVIELPWDASAYNDKTICGQEHINYMQKIYEYSFVSFSTSAPSAYERLDEIAYRMPDGTVGYDLLSTAIAADGTLYANAAKELYKLNPETGERTYVATFWLDDVEIVRCRNLIAHPDSGEIFAWVNLWQNNNAQYAGMENAFCKLDLETGEVTPLWEVKFLTWAIEFIDSDTLAVWGNMGQSLELWSAEDGSVLKTLKFNVREPKRNEQQFGAAGPMCADMLYDAESNCLYMSSDFSFFRYSRYNAGGVIKYDLDTGDYSFHTVGYDKGLMLLCLWFPEDVKAKEFYIVETLIDAIGGVTLGSGEAIEAAREAYDALSDKEKSYVTNYEDLVAAELRYAVLKAENASYQAALYYAKMVRFSLDSFDTSKLNVHQRELFNDAVADFDAALKSATTAEEVNEALSALLLIVENLDKLCPACAFADVDAGAWYHSAVDFVLDAGLMRGYEDGTFKPQSNMTRAEFVQVIYRAAGEASVEGLENPFKDVKDGFWAHDAIVWAASEGYVNGLSEDTFGPNETITREQIITIIYRIVDEGPVEEDYLADFADANAISDYAKDAMNWAVSEGILEGDAGKLRPRDKVTRAEVATIIMRID